MTNPLHSPEAERAVLGAVLLDPGPAWRAVRHLAAGDFYRADHRTVYAAIAELAEEGETIDALTVAERLATATDAPPEGGWPGWLAELADGTPSAANAATYAGIVASRAERRRVREAGHAIAAAAETDRESARTLADRAAGLLRTFEAGEPPTLRPVAEWHGQPEPAPVLWHDVPGADAWAPPDAVLSAGEVAILSAPGGSGKSYLTLALARAAAVAADNERLHHGAACGLRVRPGPVVLVSYEDSPVRIAGRLARMAVAGEGIDWGGPVPPGIHCWPAPGPLFSAGGAPGREARPADTWPGLWAAIADVAPALVIIDPVSAALADLSGSESGPVRAFMGALAREAEGSGAGVLLVAHDTKAARAEVRAGGEPGAGAVAGSATWHDAARGVLYLTRSAEGPRLDCIKSNYGRSGWTVQLAERFAHGGRFAGFEVAPAPLPGGRSRYA